MTLDGFYNDARSNIRAQFLGKRVRITDCATTVPECLDHIEGVVEEIEFGSFGYEGEGDALFWMVEVTDASSMVWRWNSTTAGAVADGRGKVMVSNKYTQIEFLD